jgi:hypothetical protein
MNRTRSMMLAAALGAFGFGTTSAQAQTQAMGGVPAPSYSYAPSAGYYVPGPYVVTQPAPRYYRGYDVFSAPAWSSRLSPGSVMHDRFSSSYDPTGRHDRLARPWLR